ncbi:MAG: hypothetical protein M1828_001522 [Chrysothrix sp. TS-e1954]|nr:MAG: hypothetical protein M1828_001522 [Chrysothrix sp. TS-e1954]
MQYTSTLLTTIALSTSTILALPTAQETQPFHNILCQDPSFSPAPNAQDLRNAADSLQAAGPNPCGKSAVPSGQSVQVSCTNGSGITLFNQAGGAVNPTCYDIGSAAQTLVDTCSGGHHVANTGSLSAQKVTDDGWGVIVESC